MAALAVAGAVASSRGPRAARRAGRWWRAGALLGLAFEVKLVEALLPVAAAARAVVVRRPARAPVASGRARRCCGGAFVASRAGLAGASSASSRCTRGRGRSARPTARRGTRRSSTTGSRGCSGGRQRPREAPAGVPWRSARGAMASPLRRSAGVAAPTPRSPARARARGGRGRRPARRRRRCGCCPRRRHLDALDRHRGSSPRWRRSPSRSRSAGRAASAASAAAGCWRSALWLVARPRAVQRHAGACARATWPASTPPSPPAWARASRSPSARAPRPARAGGRRRAVRGPGPAARHGGRRGQPRRPGARAHRGDAGGARRRAVGLPARAQRRRRRRGGVSAPSKAGPLIAHDGRPVLILPTARATSSSRPRRWRAP